MPSTSNRLLRHRFLLPLGLAALAAGGAQAQTAIELKYASAAPPTSLFAKQVERLATDIGAETKGAIKVTPFHNSQLGSETDVIGQIARGRVDMGGFAAGAMALQVPEIGLLQLPFYFDNAVQRDCVMDNHAKPLVVEGLAKKGLQFLAWGEAGSLELIGKRAFTAPADVKGIKMGSFANKVSIEFWKHMGTNPVPTMTPDLASSLQTGLIESFATVPVFYVPSGLNKIAPVMSKVDIAISLTINVMNKAAYEKLPAELRADLDRGVLRTPTATVRSEIRSLNESLLKMHRESGGTVAEATPAQRAQWQKGLQPFWASVVKDLGPAGERLFAAMEAGKLACSK